MDNNLRTLGPAEAKVVLSLREQGRSVVRTSDVLAVLGSDSTTRKVIRNLVRKGWLSRIVGGRYMLLPPEHGPENLGEYHGFTTQKPMTIFVAVLRQTAARVIESSDVRFVKVTPRKFFGHNTYDVYGRTVSISTPVKTVIDCLDRPELAGGPAELTRIVHSGLSEIDPQELLATATAMKSRSVLQRLGFIADLVSRPLPEEVRTTIKQALPKTYRSHFGRRSRRADDIGYVADWGLFVNARREELLAEVQRIKSRDVH
jgi:predicted transcriptional regulator of viral defense system